MTLASFLAILGTALLFAGMVPVMGRARRKATLELLQQELQIETEARIAQEVRCKSELARLEGRIEFLTRDFAAVIAAEVVRVLQKNGVIP